MSGKRVLPMRALQLTKIIEELEKTDDKTTLTSVITILPLENANVYITDEDSGDGNVVNLHNLPGSQLRAEAEIGYSESSSDDDDNTSLSHFATKRCSNSVLQETNTSDSPVARTNHSLSTVTTVCQKYTWRYRHNPRGYSQRQNDQAPKYLQSPLNNFEAFMNNEVFDLLVDYKKFMHTEKIRRIT